ncbi:MAG: D-glycero-beta-D-manno-heptose 1-phosphate adenylyltransferase [Candidatus Cloacimonadota bacterium]|nr:MAG: D-glycero-beta-D-manno-heptose 1-phosphate adenylyltransferase [Candidatus Cloacimonadota bacterium]PIE78482.1 MAG: D-glycero-beta-D-manno-heptose 1-phosphate adenylyltransferase [Candidatus Delongbacteria bacterium]
MNRYILDILENRDGKKIVFTNGVFDILHKGHVDYLIEAKKLGDFLIVGINSDASVKRLKGENRPINGEADRSFIVQNLKSVDKTIIFDDDTPYTLIKSIMPDILVKGGDYDPNESDKNSKKYIVGSDIVRERGGSVISIDLTEGRSTTSIIEKAKNKG